MVSDDPDFDATDQSHHVAGQANLRQQSHFSNARRHSVFVKVLKRALPMAVIGLVGWFVLTSLIRSPDGRQISLDSIGVSSGNLVMENPRVKGFNDENRPYDLNATKAIQNLKKTNLVTLLNIVARLPTGENGYADIVAKNGHYDSEKEWLSLNQDIVVESAGGLRMLLSTAEIDLKSGKLVSNKPVKVSTENTTITADNMEILDNGDIVIFNQRVRMIMQPAANNE